MSLKFLKFFLFFILLFLAGLPLECQQRDRFVFTVMKYDGGWDPYPFIYADILSFLKTTTSIKAEPSRRTVSIKDELLFSSPFVIMTNNGSFNGWTDEEREIIKKYLENGGLMFIDDSSGEKNSRFNTQIRMEFKKVFPKNEFGIISKDHAIFRSFYLLRAMSGRAIVNNYIEGMDIDGRTAVIYSQNDVLGSWARDMFGNYFLPCTPGGESQRFESQKLTINMIVFSLTGTYKTDFIHRPFIRCKLEYR